MKESENMNTMLQAEDNAHAVPGHSSPPLWEVPRIDFNDVTVENTSQLLELLPTNTDFSTLVVEEFWARLVKLAATDYPGAMRAALGVPPAVRSGLIVQWANDPLEFSSVQPLSGTVSAARDQQILENLGSIPCLLSTPTAYDLSVDFEEFVQRVEEYRYLGQAVLLADLYLALLRIDFHNIDESLIDELGGEVDFAIQLDSATTSTVNVARLCHSFKVESVFDHNEASGLDTTSAPVSVFLKSCLDIDPRTVPLTDDADDHILHWQPAGCDDAVGEYAQQVAYRRHPLAPATLINLVALQRNTSKGPITGAKEALLLAWEHGLIDLEQIDIGQLDWSPQLEKIPSLVAALTELAADGLLALSWSVWDAILGYAATYQGRKLGMVEVVRALELALPQVQAAVSEGAAPESVFELPGLRAFAELSGRSKAILAAKELVKTVGSHS